MVKKYFLKNFPLEAIQYTGDNLDEILKWCLDAYVNYSNEEQTLRISSTTCKAQVEIGDYIVSDVLGNYCNLSESDFKAQYKEILVWLIIGMIIKLIGKMS